MIVSSTARLVPRVEVARKTLTDHRCATLPLIDLPLPIHSISLTIHCLYTAIP